MIGRYDPNQYKELGFSYKLLKESQDDLVRLHPDANDNFLLNASCFLACAYDKREEAKDLFARIGANWKNGVWQDEETLNKYRNWAFDKTENIPEPEK